MTVECKEVLKLLSKVEGLGWSVTQEGDDLYRLGNYSPYGQDFSISVEGETVEQIINSIHESYENFDVSYETYLWLDSSGHGANGAPYEMRDVLDDMESCEQMIYDLWRALY